MNNQLAIFKNLKINEAEISGEADLPALQQLSIPITLTFEDGEDIQNEDVKSCQNFVNFSIARISKLNSTKLEKIIYDAAHDITKAAYSDVVPKNNLDELVSDMQLKEIVFFYRDLLLVFVSPKIFEEHDINVQLSDNLEIIETTIDL